MPGAFGRDAAGKGLVDGGRKVKKLQRYEEGEKQVYFADDNDKTLDDLVREQRHGGGSHMDSNLADKIARKSRFRLKPSTQQLLLRIEDTWQSYHISLNRTTCR